ncbi:T9SS type A sorting domain-containing protein [Candidatus Poribacteria bacterium]|nr:T9SS type A sorting domain-containing protein [Candidatus Poribacteria bacterium]
MSFKFTDTSIVGDFPLLSWAWDFDDDGVIDSIEQHPEQTYSVPGIYTVKLDVSDGTFSNVKIKENFITVNPAQPGDLDGDGEITTDDAELILQFIVGVIDEFPITSQMVAAPHSDQPRHYAVSLPSLAMTRDEQRMAVPIYLSEQNHFTDLSGGGITLTYDSTVLKATSAVLNLNGSYYGQVNLNLDGEVRVTFLSTPPASIGRGDRVKRAVGTAGNVVLWVEFDVLPGANVPTTPLILSRVQLAHSTSIQKTHGMLQFRPNVSRLLQNFPNPFNPETWIPFHLSEDAEVSITIYDVQGKLVRTLPLGTLPAGYYDRAATAIHWDGSSDTGEQVASGVYFYHLKAGDDSQVQRMVILK